MQDPSQGIARDLAPHVHLLSTFRFPQLLSINNDKACQYLLEAPGVTRDRAPFYWTYLDRPADGTILLVWQSPSMGNDFFPSDGYIWAPQELHYQVEVAGYIMDVFYQRTGYGQNEPVATHARRRYRLQPSNSNPNSTDPCLWLVHWLPAEPNERVPSNMLPVDGRIHNIMGTRSYLHTQGQIVQKEFMLNDRPSWPTIAFPRNQRPAMYGGNVPPSRVPQNMAYPGQPSHPGPPVKRSRPNPPNPNQPAVINAVSVIDPDDEEDTSRGDFFDHTTPREISMARYRQNHEWMEEILNSPYAINQLIPADLGLGLRGHLATITDGIFDAPLDPDNEEVKYSYVGQLDKDKAEEFRKRAGERIEQTNKEMEKMKAKHAKRLAKFRKGSQLSEAEKDLRTAVDNPSDMGPEYWRLEGRVDTEDDDEEKPVLKVPAKVADIIAQVEASVGRHAAAVKELVRIQDGGYEEPVAAIPSPEVPAAPTPRITPPGSNNGSNNSGVMIGDSDIDMTATASGLIDNIYGAIGSSATPGSSFPTPQANLQALSSVGTPGSTAAPSQPAAPVQQSQHADVAMADAAEQANQSEGTGKDDWVVVPPGGVSPTRSSQPLATSQPSEMAALSTSTPSGPTIANPSPLPTTSSNQTPVADFHTSPNDFADLGDLEGAGDAMATFDGASGELGDMGMDMDVGMDDSAFGDAFHGVELREGEGDGL